MDAGQFEKFLEIQKAQNAELLKMFQNMSTSTSGNQGSVTSMVPVPYPERLDVDSENVEENFKLFKNNWHSYCKATGMDKWGADMESRKINILLSFVGDSAKKKYNNFSLTDENLNSTAKDVLDLIEKQIVSKKNWLFDRFVFRSCEQKEDENFEEYINRLRRAVETCKYDQGVSKETMIRDQLVFGVKDLKLKRHFLEEDPDKLTLDKVINTCKAQEITAQTFERMVNKQSSDLYVNKMESKEVRKMLCKFCGRKHAFVKGACPAIGNVCNFCNGLNHFERVCLKKHPKKTDNGKFKNKRVHKIDDDDSDSSVSSGEDDSKVKKISKIVDNSSQGGTVQSTLKMRFNDKWQKVLCELDTGAQVCIIGWKTYCKLMNIKNPPLSPSSMKLKSFGGSNIEVLGQTVIRCSRKKQLFDVKFQVVNNSHGPLLSANACKELELIKFCNQIQNSIKQNVIDNHEGYKETKQIIKNYERIFNGYGLLKGEINLEVNENVQPVIQPPRRVGTSLRKDLKQEIEKLVKDGIIVQEQENTEWVSNVLVVKQKGKMRLCLDPIALNAALKRPHYQTTTIDEILPELGKAKVFSTVDLKKGFWHLKLNEKSSKLTCFWTPFGRYRWVRLPFGLNSSPELFAMAMSQVVHGLKGVEILADDILIYGTGENIDEALRDHNQNLKNLFERLLEKNCRLNKEKIILCRTSVKFFGNELTVDGIKADKMKVIAIQAMPAPQNKQDLLRFIGMVTYLSRFIPNLSSRVSKLRKLTHGDSEWKWTDGEQKEFEELKKVMSDLKTLSYFDRQKEVIIECDASSFGLGAAMFQDSKVVSYASRTLTKAEKNYAQIEKEMLAIVFACRRFDQYIVGMKIKVKTDHHPLLSIFKKPLIKAPKRLQQMMMILQRYNIELEFVKGKDNIVADSLSRAPVDLKHLAEEEFSRADIFEISAVDENISKKIEDVDVCGDSEVSDDLILELKNVTREDHTCSKIIDYIRNGWPSYINQVPDDVKMFFKFKDELSYQHGLIIRNDRIFVPLALRKKMICKLHTAHSGIEYTLNLARDNLFWPGMSSQIKDVVTQCEVCAKFASSQPKSSMQSFKIPCYPFQEVSMDVFFDNDAVKQRKYLVIADHFSDFFEIEEIKDLKPCRIVDVCKKIFSRHGIPEKVNTDNATNFVNREMKEFARKWNFRHSTSAPHHQQANGKAEAAVKVAKKILKKTREKNEDFWFALLHHRNTPNNKSSSPSQRLFSRKTRSSIPSLSFQPKIVDDAKIKIKQAKENAKFYYDQHARRRVSLEIGQPVYVQVNSEVSKTWSPGTVEQKFNERSFLVNVNGSTFRRNVDNIKPRSLNFDGKSSGEMQIDQQNSSTNSNLNQEQEASTSSTINSTGFTHNPLQNSRPQRVCKMPAKLKDYIVRRE